MRPVLDIRQGQRSDLPGVLALYAQPALDNDTVLDIPVAEQMLARFSRYPDYTLYVATHEKQIVGSFALLIMENLGHLGAPSAVGEDVVVDPALHGHGIGQVMMAFAAETAHAKHCYELVLPSNAEREAAHEFYEGLGFERHGYSFRLRLDEVTA